MTYDEVLKYYKTVAKLRLRFNPPISHQAIYNWKKNGVVPLAAQYTLNQDSHGKLKIKMHDAVSGSDRPSRKGNT